MQQLQKLIPDLPSEFYTILLSKFISPSHVFQTISGIPLEITKENSQLIEDFFKNVYSNPSPLLQELLQRYQLGEIKYRALEENFYKIYTENRRLKDELEMKCSELRANQIVQKITMMKSNQALKSQKSLMSMYLLSFSLVIVSIVFLKWIP